LLRQSKHEIHTRSSKIGRFVVHWIVSRHFFSAPTQENLKHRSGDMGSERNRMKTFAVIQCVMTEDAEIRDPSAELQGQELILVANDGSNKKASRQEDVQNSR
jgi:hypothetical protein